MQNVPQPKTVYEVKSSLERYKKEYAQDKK